MHPIFSTLKDWVSSRALMKRKRGGEGATVKSEISRNWEANKKGKEEEGGGFCPPKGERGRIFLPSRAVRKRNAVMGMEGKVVGLDPTG